MSEDLKEDIINDINRLLSKESMQGNVQENRHAQQMNELSPQAIAHMQKQMHQQQMEQQIPQMQQMPPMQHHMPSQVQHNDQLSPQMMAQLHQAQQQQAHKQLLQQQMAQQMQQAQAQAQAQAEEKPIPPPILKKQVVEHLDNGSSNNTMDTVKNTFFEYRDPLVLLLLFCVICTPQVNKLLCNIPNTSDLYSYPNYLGILLRGVLLVGTYLALKKLNFI
jgi:hypothetical protein